LGGTEAALCFLMDRVSRRQGKHNAIEIECRPIEKEVQRQMMCAG
jgi:hypothetical protein